MEELRSHKVRFHKGKNRIQRGKKKIYYLAGLIFTTLDHLLLYLFIVLVALSLCYYMWAFSVCSKWGLLFVAVRGLLIAVASLAAETGP